MKQKKNLSLISRKHSGFSLLEVLISVTILVLGLVGLAALQARTLMMNQSTFYRNVAADLATNLSERIHANKSPFVASSDSEVQPAQPPDFSKCYQNTDPSTLTCDTQPSGHEAYLVATEMNEWNSALRDQLPGGTYTLTQVPGSSSGRFRYSLTITWLDDRTKQTNSSDLNNSYSVVIE